MLTDLANKTFQQAVRGFDLYRKQFLVSPTACTINGTLYDRSRKAILEIGEASANDMVALRNGAVAKIISFWQRSGDESIIAELEIYECINDDVRIRALQRFERAFFDVANFVDTCVWFVDSPAIMRVSLPPALLYA